MRIRPVAILQPLAGRAPFLVDAARAAGHFLRTGRPGGDDPTGRRYSVAMKSTSFFIASAAVALLSVQTPAQQPSSTIAFTGARVIDGTDRAPIDNATILVRDGRIVAVGPAARVTVPAGAAARAARRQDRDPRPGQRARPRRQHRRHGAGALLRRERAARSAHLRRLRRHDGRTRSATIRPPAFAARDAQNTPTLDRARLFVAGPVLAPKTPTRRARWSTPTRR